MDGDDRVGAPVKAVHKPTMVFEVSFLQFHPTTR